jgi:hypothetical protein
MHCVHGLTKYFAKLFFLRNFMSGFRQSDFVPIKTKTLHALRGDNFVQFFLKI